ncbi:MAG: glycerate kinase [Desulfovibrionaceae bacterium]|nr:glycerate kinase [Desulfovibrionaceae bacterium]
MRVLIAPDSFKGSLSALEAAQSMARGVRSVFDNAVCDLAPIADGGEGTVDALTAATGGEIRVATVRGPLGKPVEARWGLLGNSRAAVVEMAAASGLPLLTLEERDPLRADTYGTGELIRAALAALHDPARGVDKAEDKPTLIIGIGGSATNDAGSGALRALGLRFLDASGKELEPGGAALAGLARIDSTGIDPLLAQTRIRVACDVDNPLTGERGASAVFGPQKGATPEMVRQLDAALTRFAEVARESTGKDLAATPGAGAAGGLGAGLLFFAGAKLEPGIAIVLEATGLAARAGNADLVITGEGRSDVQTAYGKAPVGVAKIAKQHGKPVICISGALGPGVEAVYDQGIDALAAVVSSIDSLEHYMEHAGVLLENAAARACRMVRVGMRLD